MNVEQSILIIVVIAVVLLMVMGTRTTYLVRGMIVRLVVSVFLIYLTNYLLESIGYVQGVGINIYNLLVSLLLGFPGIILLYVIHMSQFL